MPLILLRTYDDQGQPEMRPSAQWAPRPPVDAAFRAEWWQHSFSVAYWLNVRNNYSVTHFQVLNEPDWVGQGWLEYGGTSAQYVQLVQDAYDAISYANSFAGLPVYLHAPVVADYNSPYVTAILDNADAAVQVVDYHTYADNVLPSIAGISSTINSHNTDAILEPIWVSEWGALWSTYDTFERAMLTAKQLLTFSEKQVQGVTVFNMYDWSATPGQDYGLLDLQSNGGKTVSVPTETYYAYRLMLRGLVSGKQRLPLTTFGLDSYTQLMATRDEDNIYVIFLRDSTGASIPVTLDLAELGIGYGTARVFEYSLAFKDEVVISPTVSAGILSFTAPANGLSLVVVPRPDLSASTKVANTADVHPGEMLTYTLILSNSSSVGPLNAWLTDALPANTILSSGPWASNGVAGFSGGVITWTGAITPGLFTTVEFRLGVLPLVCDGALISNTAMLDDGSGQIMVITSQPITVSFHRLALPLVLRSP